MTTLKRIGVGLTAFATAFTALFSPVQELFPVAAAAAQEVQDTADTAKKPDPTQPEGKGTSTDPFKIGTSDQLWWFAGYVNGTLPKSKVEDNKLGTDGSTSDISSAAPETTTEPETSATDTTSETETTTATEDATEAATEESTESASDTSAEVAAVLEEASATSTDESEVTTADTTSTDTPEPEESTTGTASTTTGSTPAPEEEKVEAHPNACAILTADIDLQGSTGNKDTMWYPIGKKGSGLVLDSTSVRFNGEFDGKGHTIKGLYIDTTVNYGGRAYSFGLFGNNYGTIKNVEVCGTVSYPGMYVGLICSTNEGTIENCIARGNIYGSYAVGGIAGYNTGYVKNCYSDIKCSGTNYGTIVGISGKKSEAKSDEGYGVYNCYYNTENFTDKGVGQGHTEYYSVDGVSPDDLKTGETAWKLQNGKDEEKAVKAANDIIWGQELSDEGKDNSPVLLTDEEKETKQVCQVTYKLGDQSVGYEYVNVKDCIKNAPKIDYVENGYTAGDKWFKDKDNTEDRQEWKFNEEKVENDITLYSERTPHNYTITLDMNGGTLTDTDKEGWTEDNRNYTKTYTVQSNDITLPKEATKEGFKFVGWTSEQTDNYSGEAKKDITVTQGSTGDRKFKAEFLDATAPEININLDKHNWKILHEDPQFDLFFTTNQTVTITATDEHSQDNVKIEYLISKEKISKSDLEKKSGWKTYTQGETGIELSPQNQTTVIIYVKVSDGSNIAYASTTGLVFDIDDPVISGISNDGVYCTDATFSVKENNVKTIKVNETVLYDCKQLTNDPEPEDDLEILSVASVVVPDHLDVSELREKYTITNNSSEEQTYTITVIDKADHQATATVKINGQHIKQFRITEVLTNPTCTSLGVERVDTLCKVCGSRYESEMRNIEAKGHTWRDWEYVETPDCDDKGFRKRSCRICNFTEEQNLDPNGHDWQEEPTIDQAPTCDSQGSQSIHCKNCDATKENKVLPKLEHKPGEPQLVKSVPATCTSDGINTIVTYCDLCGEEVDLENVTVASPGHKYGEWEELISGTFQRECEICKHVENKNGDNSDHKWATEYTIDKAATCTTDGSKSIRCTVCGTAKESVTIPATGHTAQTAIKENETLATCTDGGYYEEVTYCRDCHTELTRVKKTTIANGHSWGKWTDLQMPDCDDDGTQQHTCSICGATETRGLNASGHTWAKQATVDVPPTCTTEGSRSIHCTKCDATQESEVIPALGHTWGEWETLNAPDCDDTGTQQRKCTVCGVTETNGLEASGHKWESFYTVDVPPTCTTDGSKSYHCEVCDICGAAEVIPALGHDWGEWETLDAPDCDDAGTQQRSCKVCGVTETKGLEAAGHKWETTYTIDVEPTCTTEGSQSYHCEVCDVRGASVVVPALGHTWSEWETLDMPDCDDAGTQQRHCEVCGVTETKGLEAAGHKWKTTYTIDVQPTCTTEGSKSYHCEICDVRGASEVIPALGHTWGEWQTLDMPDCDDSGTQQRSCEVCGVTETKGLDPAGHKWQSEFTVDTPPTCMDEGSKSIHCENCDATKDSTIIPPTDDHSWGEWETVVDATCVKEGIKEHECTVCKKTETDVIPIDENNHQYGEWVTVNDADCGNEGVVKRECELCGHEESAFIPATENHTPKAAVRENEKPADCGHSGSYESVVYCEVCGVEISRETKTIPATGAHKYTVKVVAPTYGAKGYTLHTCSVCGDSYKDKETAKLTLDAVKGFGLKARAADAIRVKWTKNTKADGYELERLVDGKWKSVGKVSSTVAEYKYSGLSGSTKYEFRIRAYKVEGGKTYYSAYTTTHYTTNPTVVKNFKLTARTAKTLTFSWTKDTSADGYIIEKKVGNDWKRVTKLVGNTKLGYIVSGLSAGTAYSIRIKPYHMAGSTALYGKTVTISARTAPSDVSGLKLKGRAANALRLGWAKNTSADGYIIEKKVGNTWKRVTKLTKNTTLEYRITGLSAGTEYMFRVRSYKMSGKTALYSGYVYGTYTTNPSAASGLKLKNSAKDAVRLSWTKNTGADGYIIEMKLGGTWKRAGKITKNSTVEFKKSGLKSKTSYSFRIKTYKMSGKTALYGATKTITVKTK